MKKLIAILVSATMIFALCATVFAAPAEVTWEDYQQYLIDTAGSNAPDLQEFIDQVEAIGSWDELDQTVSPWDQMFTTIGLSTWEEFAAGEVKEALVPAGENMGGGDSAEGESEEGESPEGESPEGESPEGESAEQQAPAGDEQQAPASDEQLAWQGEGGAQIAKAEANDYLNSPQYSEFSSSRLRSTMEMFIPTPYDSWSFDDENYGPTKVELESYNIDLDAWYAAHSE